MRDRLFNIFAIAALVIAKPNFVYAKSVNTEQKQLRPQLVKFDEEELSKIESLSAASNSDSLVIEKNGKTIYENFYGADDRARNIQSATKSICALAIEILIQKGRIQSLDEPMFDWIPAWKTDSTKSKITLRMILNHTSGLPDVNTVTDFWSRDDIISAAESATLISEPGEHFLYSNIGASLLQPVIEQASGQTVANFIREQIFKPLNITDAFWKTDHVGHERTSGGLFLSTNDLLKIGNLILNHGKRGGKRILPENSLLELFTQSQPFRQYGLLWWLGSSLNLELNQPDLVYAKGWGGQFIVVVFSKNIVAVRTRDPESIDLKELDQAYFHSFPELVSHLVK